MRDGQILQIALTKGLHQRKAGASIEPGELRTATNARFSKVGLLAKRAGTTLLPAAVATDKVSPQYPRVGPPSIVSRSFAHFQYGAEEVRCASVNRLYAFANQTELAWLSRDYVAEGVATRRPLQNLAWTNNFLSPDVVVCNGYEVWAWMQTLPGSPILVAIYEAATGTLVVAPVLPISSRLTAVAPRLTQVGNRWVALVYGDSNDTNLRCRILDTTVLPLAWGPETTISVRVAGGAIPLFDTTTVTGDTVNFCFVVADIAGGVTLALINASTLATTQTTAFGTETPLGAVAVQGTAGETLWVGWSGVSGGNTLVQASGRDPATLAQSFAPFTVANLGATGTASWITLARAASVLEDYIWEDNSSGQTNVDTIRSQRVTSVGANTGTLNTTRGLTPSSKAFRYQGKTYLLGYYNSAVQGTYFWLDLNTEGDSTAKVTDYWARVVAPVANRLAGLGPGGLGLGGQRSNSSLMNVQQPAPGVNDQFFTGGNVVVGSGITGQTRLWRLAMNFRHPNRASGGGIGHLALLGTQAYDGQTCSELGWHLFPEAYTATVQVGAGNLGNGLYSYIAIYVWTHASGETVRSSSFGTPTGTGSPNQAATATTSAGNNQVVVGKIQIPNQSTKNDGESGGLVFGSVEIYRTLVAGSIYYRLTTISFNGANGAPGAYVANFTDNVADATLQQNPILYFTPGASVGVGGGVLDNVSPPCFSHTIVHKNRIFGVGDDLRTIWFSKSYTEGEQPGFNEALTLFLEDGTDILALATLDEKLLIGTQLAWYVVFGDGPDDTGAGSDLTPPQRLLLERPLGPINADGSGGPATLVNLPEGVVYQTADGQLYMITRSLETVWLSDKVEDLLATYSHIFAAAMFAPAHELRVECSNPAGTAGVELVYNLYTREWTVNSRNGAIGQGVVATTCASILVLGVLTWRFDDAVGNAWTEDATGTVFTDNGAWVTYDVETADLNLPHALAGYARIRRVIAMGPWGSPHDSTLTLATDFGSPTPDPKDSIVHTSDQTDGAPLLEVALSPSTQLAHTFRVRFTDAPPTGLGDVVGSGRGAILTSFSFEYDDERGAGKLIPPAQQG